LRQQSLDKAELTARFYRHPDLPGIKTRESQKPNFATIPSRERAF
jgi:hypothetical protein